MTDAQTETAELIESASNVVTLRIAQVIGGIAAALLVVLIGWLANEALANRENRLSKDRYTASQGQELEMRVERRLSEWPPNDLADDLRELRADVKRLDASVTRLQVLVERLEKM